MENSAGTKDDKSTGKKCSETLIVRQSMATPTSRACSVTYDESELRALIQKHFSYRFNKSL